MEWEKVFANNTSDIWLISKIYKELIEFNIKKKIKVWDKQTFFQRRYTDGQQAHEKRLNITNCQVNAIQNQNDISPHTCQNGYQQKDNK